MLTQRPHRGIDGIPAIFVAPVLAETTMRFVESTAALDGVRLALITQEPAQRLSARLRGRLAAYERVPDGLDPDVLTRAVRAVAGRIGRPHRLFGALEQLQVPLAIVRERLGIEGPGVEVATNFRDKAQMKDVLRAAGVPCARHGLAHDAAEGRRIAADIGFPLVAKPPAGAAAKGTYRVDDEGQLGDVLRIARPTADDPLLLEEFVIGEEHSFDSVMIAGRPVWYSLTHYIPGPLQVMENPWIQWTVLLPREMEHPRYDDIRDVAYRALRALGLETGLTHMEWFRRKQDGSVAVSEVGARPPGAQFTTLISYAHDIDFYRAWGRLMVFDSFTPPPRKYAAGIAYLRGQGRGRVVAIHGLERMQRELGELVVETRLPRLGSHPASSYEGDGYVVLRHPDTAVVADALRRLVAGIRVELG